MIHDKATWPEWAMVGAMEPHRQPPPDAFAKIWRTFAGACADAARADAAEHPADDGYQGRETLDQRPASIPTP